MPKQRPMYFPGGVYHVYNRGSHKASIFREADNYLFVLRKIKKYVGELDLSLLAYCLMPNHYHFLIRLNGEQPAGRLSQRVFNSYSKAYNLRYRHSGTLFEGAYHVKPVMQDTHVLQLCRYIHANPVKDGLVAGPGDWPYSNYLDWVGVRDETLVDRDFVRAFFNPVTRYVDFVLEYLRTRQLPAEVADYLRRLEG